MPTTSTPNDGPSIYRLAWDFIGSGLGSRNELYERNYLGSAKTTRTHHTLMYSDRDAAYALVDSMLRVVGNP